MSQNRILGLHDFHVSPCYYPSPHLKQEPWAPWGAGRDPSLESQPLLPSLASSQSCSLRAFVIAVVKPQGLHRPSPQPGCRRGLRPSDMFVTNSDCEQRSHPFPWGFSVPLQSKSLLACPQTLSGHSESVTLIMETKLDFCRETGSNKSRL